MYRTSLSRLALPLVVFLSLVATQAIAQQTAAQTSRQAPDILITDFEFETFPADWKVTGDAFGTGPVTGPFEIKLGEGNVRMYGYPIKAVDSLRKGLVASFENAQVSDDAPLDVDLGGKQLLDINATVTIRDAKRLTFVFGE